MIADGPSALRSLNPGPGIERPVFTGLPAGASNAGAFDERVSGIFAEIGHETFIVIWGGAVTVDTHPAVAPATGAPTGSPSQEGRSIPGPGFSDRRAEGPPAITEPALSYGRTLPPQRSSTGARSRSELLRSRVGAHPSVKQATCPTDRMVTKAAKLTSNRYEWAG